MRLKVSTVIKKLQNLIFRVIGLCSFRGGPTAVLYFLLMTVSKLIIILLIVY